MLGCDSRVQHPMMFIIIIDEMVIKELIKTNIFDLNIDLVH